MSDDLVKRLRETTHMYQVDCELKMKCADRIEELEAENKRLRLEIAHANDTADAAIERAKELDAALPEQIEWVKRLADDLIAAEAKLAKAEMIIRIIASDKWDERLGEAVDLSCEYLAEIEGQGDAK